MKLDPYMNHYMVVQGYLGVSVMLQRASGSDMQAGAPVPVSLCESTCPLSQRSSKVHAAAPALRGAKAHSSAATLSALTVSCAGSTEKHSAESCKASELVMLGVCAQNHARRAKTVTHLALKQSHTSQMQIPHCRTLCMRNAYKRVNVLVIEPTN